MAATMCVFSLYQNYESILLCATQFAAINAALSAAKLVTSKPTFIHVRTVIGFGSRKANTGPAHGQALGDAEVEYVKGVFGFDPTAKFVVPDAVYGT